MIDELKGIGFDLFMTIGKNEIAQSIVELKIQNYYIRKAPIEHINSALDNLISKGLVNKFKDSFYIINNGKDFLNEYHEYGIAEIIEKRFDRVILQFLYKMDTPISFVDFPNSILSHVEAFSQESPFKDLQDYFTYHSPYKTYWTIEDYKVKLNPNGRKYYEQLIIKEELQKAEFEKEKAEFEKDKNLKYLLLEKQVNKLELELKDYKGIKRRSKWSFGISILAVVIVLSTLLMKWFGLV